MQNADTVTLLLVDDDEVDVELFQRTLKQQKIVNPLVVATDGIYALEKLRGENGDKVCKPYVILLDLNMPRMGGIEFLKELRNDPEISDSIVFVLTTSSSEKDILNAYQFNVAGYIVKSDFSNEFFHALGMLDQYWRVIQLPV